MLEAMKALGFTGAGWVNPRKLQFQPQVRAMCAENLCHSYGKNWCCPPACGKLEALAARAGQFSQGLVLLSRSPLMGTADMDEMKRAELSHQKLFHRAMAFCRARYERIFPMGAGVCSLCPQCSYPQSPCRHPQWLAPSMEACGLIIRDVCQAATLPYLYGETAHITFVSLILLSEKRAAPLPEEAAPEVYYFKPWGL